ncbi:MAG: hypothetical protein K0M40_18605 [Prolixibacteraceae bacterium]|nr:hypothetical protein [Prolixibacteraceae bacterium]
MKKLLTILICLSLMAEPLIAQTPNAFKYQAVVRDNAGQIVVSKNVGFRISILQTIATGSVVYSEKHTAQTNAFGLVNLEIGSGTIVSGIFSTIDWGSGSFFVKIELDANNNGSFSEMGTSQLLSVPYSLYANKAGNGLTISGAPQPGDILFNNGISWGLLSKGINGQTLRLDNGLPNWGEPGYALPLVTTSAVTDVLQTGAKSGGNIIATGFTDITAHGVCWGINQNPTIADSKTVEGKGIGTFTSTIINLESNTTYYLRAYATNSAGTAYGNQVTFKTILNVVFPTTITAAVTNITANAVTSGGSVTATGGGEVTARGVCWSDHQNPTISDSKTSDGAGTGEFQSQISGLIPGTYYARAYATNSAGTGYGNMVTFATEKTLPVLTTKAITDISAMGAVSGGNITSAGGGTISGRGICWSESPNPTIANEKTTSTATTSSFSAAIAKACPGTTYYLKAYATNEIGTGYGEQRIFTTSDAQYYTSFESGMTPVGWSGPFTVSNASAFEGSFSFKSLANQGCDAIYSTYLSSSGQISFYYKIESGASIDFYIDNVMIASYPDDGSGWRQGISPVTAGNHILKWHFNAYGGWRGICYIDQIIITK